MDSYEEDPELVYRSSDGSVFEYELSNGWLIMTERRMWDDGGEDGEPQWLGWWFEITALGYEPIMRGDLYDSIYLPSDLSGVFGPYDSEAEALAASMAFHHQVATNHALWQRYLGEMAANRHRWRLRQ